MTKPHGSDVGPDGTEGGPLSGLVVLELGTFIAGPFVGRRLADFGAQVIKVEAPGQGDPMRLQGGRKKYHGRGLNWPILNRNKKLVSIDLRVAQGQALCRELAQRSDVLIENFKPGILEAWGLGPADLWKLNPKLVIARVSGYGQDGPYAARPGLASAGEAVGGVRYINGYPDQAPPRFGIALGDLMAAVFAVQGVLMALYWRDLRGGKGQVVDASVIEGCFGLLESIIPEYGKLGVVKEPSGASFEGVAPSNVFKARDGRWIVIAANTENLWQRFWPVLARSGIDLHEDSRFATWESRNQHQQALDESIAAWATQHDSTDIDDLMSAAGVVCGRVNSIADIFADPHFKAREMLIPMIDSELGELITPGIIPKLSLTPGKARWTAPWRVGANNDEVFSQLLGIDRQRLDELADAGVI
jgi:crotonobetainyl-CoA:carnitine CoA-transferase CaiB-like acyl-CoA transferase